MVWWRGISYDDSLKTIAFIVESSNGRTTGFDPVYMGSTPISTAMKQKKNIAKVGALVTPGCL